MASSPLSAKIYSRSDIVVLTPAAVFLVVRTYALYNGNKCILWLLVISAAAVLANGVVSPSLWE
jgi:hypothetical protein